MFVHTTLFSTPALPGTGSDVMLSQRGGNLVSRSVPYISVVGPDQKKGNASGMQRCRSGPRALVPFRSLARLLWQQPLCIMVALCHVSVIWLNCTNYPRWM